MANKKKVIKPEIDATEVVDVFEKAIEGYTDEKIESVIEEIVIEPVIKVDNKPNNNKPLINDRGYIRIKCIRGFYKMVVGQMYERPAHIAMTLVKNGQAEYVQTIEA